MPSSKDVQVFVEGLLGGATQAISGLGQGKLLGRKREQEDKAAALAQEEAARKQKESAVRTRKMEVDTELGEEKLNQIRSLPERLAEFKEQTLPIANSLIVRDANGVPVKTTNERIPLQSALALENAVKSVKDETGMKFVQQYLFGLKNPTKSEKAKEQFENTLNRMILQYDASSNPAERRNLLVRIRQLKSLNSADLDDGAVLAIKLAGQEFVKSNGERGFFDPALDDFANTLIDAKKPLSLEDALLSPETEKHAGTKTNLQLIRETFSKTARSIYDSLANKNNEASVASPVGAPSLASVDPEQETDPEVKELRKDPYFAPVINRLTTDELYKVIPELENGGNPGTDADIKRKLEEYLNGK